MVIDILLVLGECHRNYINARLYAERYPDRHPKLQQIINILKIQYILKEDLKIHFIDEDNKIETLIIMIKDS